MARYAAGDLVLVPFPIPGRTSPPLSPAIVLLQWPLDIRATHCLLCLADVESTADPYEIGLVGEDLTAGEIPGQLYVRPTYLMTVSEGRIKAHVAQLTPEKLRELIECLVDALYEDIGEEA